MKKIRLTKDYPIRHDIIIAKGSYIEVTEHRAEQLLKGGFWKEKKTPKGEEKQIN